MQPVLFWLAGTVLSAYIVYEVIKTSRDYPTLKQAVAQGDAEARAQFYMRIVRFEWVSAALALVALSFDRTKLTAASLQLSDTGFGRWISSETANFSRSSGIVGIAAGLLLGLGIMSIVRLRARRSKPAPPDTGTKSWVRKVVPDIGPLIPITARERLLFAVVAISAGICEEIVFRGWLLFSLHSPFGLTGTALVLLAAMLFGLCHVYQGVTGVIGATLAGLLLTALYVVTGTLLVPIVLHALIDLRVAILPNSVPQVIRTQFQEERA